MNLARRICHVASRVMRVAVAVAMVVAFAPISARAEDSGNTLPVLADGVSASSSTSVFFEDEFQYDPSSLFFDADGDALVYWASFDGAKAVVWDAASAWSWNATGRHTVVFTAHDGKAMSQASHSLRVTVKRRVVTHEVSVHVAGDANVEFFEFDGYDDDDGTDLTGTELDAVATDDGYTVNVPYDVEAISYRATWASGVSAGASLGGMAATVSNETTDLYLRAVEMTVPGQFAGEPLTAGQVALTATYDAEHKAIVGDSYQSDDMLCFGLLAVADAGTSYQFGTTPSEEISSRYLKGALENQGIEWAAEPLRLEVPLEDLAALELQDNSLVVWQNTLAESVLKLKEPQTGTFELAPGSSMPAGLELLEDGTVKGTPTADPGTYEIAVLVRNELVSEGARFAVTIQVKPQFEYIGVKTEAKVYESWDQDLRLNAQQVRLNVGETFGFRAWRVPFIGNDGGLVSPPVIYPDFHVERIYGDSVEAPDLLAGYEISTGGSIGYAFYRTFDRQYSATAVHRGTSIFKFTYDAYEGFDIDDWVGYYSGNDPVDFVACPDCNVAYMVFTVGETGTSTIKSSLDYWSCYDTVYYSEGETCPYDITATAVGARDFYVTCNGLKVEPAADGKTYTLPLENRSNIIGMVATDQNGNQRSTWRIIDARYLTVNVDNVTNPGAGIAPGDTAKVSFKGLTMPLNRMMGYYNPQFYSPDYASNQAFRIRYHNDELGDFAGSCHQWDLSTSNSFTVTFPEEGDYLFEGIDISGQWWGAPLGSELAGGAGGFDVDDEGDAPDVAGGFCAGMLPSFTVHVEEPQGKYKRVRGTAYLSVSHDGRFWESDGEDSGTDMARVPIDLAQLSKINLDDYGLGAYDHDADGDGQYETTLLHLLVWASERYGAAGADGFAVTGDAGSMFITNLFGFDQNLNYYVNGVYPLERPGWGATADRIVISDGDFVDVGHYSAKMTSSSFQYFADEAGKPAFELSACAGEASRLSLVRTVPEENYGTSYAPAAEGTRVYYGTEYGTALGSARVGADGAAAVTFPSSDDYVVWADGDAGTVDGGGQTAPAYAVVHVSSPAAKPDLSAATAVVNGGRPVVFSGAAAKPAIVLTGADGEVIDVACYEVEYAGNEAPGTGTAFITPAGDRATGKLTVRFQIVAAEQPASEQQTSQQTADAQAAAAALAAASNINKASVKAADIQAAAKLGATTVTLGKKVKRIAKGAFKGTAVKTLIVKTKKLTKKSVKGALKGSKVKTVKVKVGSKKLNKKYVKKYKKLFTKKVCGKKAKVK